MTKNEVRKDLKEIRYYYSRKDVFEEASKTIGASRFENTIKKYNEAICQASPKLYELYYSLYMDDNTLESLADKWGFGYENVKKFNTQLIKFFQENIKEEA